jgi:hypothetical protein
MSLSKEAALWYDYFKHHPHTRVNAAVLQERGVSRRKSRAILAELKDAGLIRSIRNSRIGTRLVLERTTLVPSDTAIYSSTGSSYISNSNISSKPIYSNRAPNKFFDEVKGEEATMGYEIFKPTSTSNEHMDELLEERLKAQQEKIRVYQEERIQKQNERRKNRHREKNPVAKWSCKDVAYEFVDRMMDLWSIPSFSVTQTRFIQALGQMRKNLGTNGAVEVAMLDIFFSSIKADTFKDGNHLWKAFLQMAPSIVEQARRSVITPEQAETAKVDAETQADKKLSLFEE